MSTEDTLKQRGNVHGDFAENSRIMCELIDDMTVSPNWDKLLPFQRVALTYIAGKISRILSGDHNFAVHWHDIQGYARCVEDRLPKPLVGAHGQIRPTAPCPNCSEQIPLTVPNNTCPKCGINLKKS